MPGYGSIREWQSATGAPVNPVRSPSAWGVVGGAVIQDAAQLDGQYKWQQVLGARAGRKAWTVVNTGGNACQLANGPLPSGERGVTVAAGGTWSEEVEDEIWAYCVGGTTLDVSETYTPLLDTVVERGNSQSPGLPGGNIPYVAPLLP